MRLPFRKSYHYPVWQFDEAGEPLASMPRLLKAAEEAGIPADATWTRLDVVGRVPASAFGPPAHWPVGLLEVPEYAFGVEVAPETVVLSAEHNAVAWLPYGEAAARLRWASNRAALAELHARLDRTAVGGS